jgi:hypothetical protein
MVMRIASAAVKVLSKNRRISALQKAEMEMENISGEKQSYRRRMLAV